MKQTTNMPKELILVVDDEKTVRDVLKKSFELWGYFCETAEDGKEALLKIKDGRVYNLLITDSKMPNLGGIEVLKEIKKVNPYIEVVFLTGYPTVASAVEALKIGASDYLAKPFDLVEMEMGEILPRVYTRAELLGYLETCRRRCQETVLAMGEEQARHICRFAWGEVPFAELQLYNLRHVQEHAAQLSLFLGQQGSKPGAWISRTPEAGR